MQSNSEFVYQVLNALKLNSHVYALKMVCGSLNINPYVVTKFDDATLEAIHQAFAVVESKKNEFVFDVDTWNAGAASLGITDVYVNKKHPRYEEVLAYYRLNKKQPSN